MRKIKINIKKMKMIINLGHKIKAEKIIFKMIIQIIRNKKKDKLNKLSMIHSIKILIFVE